MTSQTDTLSNSVSALKKNKTREGDSGLGVEMGGWPLIPWGGDLKSCSPSPTSKPPPLGHAIAVHFEEPHSGQGQGSFSFHSLPKAEVWLKVT